MDLAVPFRRATPEDAPLLVELVNYAGAGFAFVLEQAIGSGGPGMEPSAFVAHCAGRRFLGLKCT